ncbi:hypothetical protein [Paenibacillus sp. LjRoot56]|uniref:hypothetical protein n=1 Tax=Paenibacillus sp. LjRoot56 TaxID=3342333 RepID=UPI003ECED536
MKYFIKLLNWEILRFSKLYGALALLLVVSQFVGIWLTAQSYLSDAHTWVDRNGGTEAQYAEKFQKLNLIFIFHSVWYEGAISLCAIVLVLYIFMIWYKEWFGRNTFAYRLLMLPTSRMNVYFAKLSAIVLFVFGFVSLQFVVIPLQLASFCAIIPAELRVTVSIGELIRRDPLLNLFMPSYVMQFILYYGAGILGVFVLFTAILLERSYRWRGIVAGILYGAAVLIVIVLPQEISQLGITIPLFSSEIVLLQVFIGLCMIAVSIGFSSYLLRKKVTV